MKDVTTANFYHTWHIVASIIALFIVPISVFAAKDVNTGYSCPIFQDMFISQSKSASGQERIMIQRAQDIYSSVCGWMNIQDVDKMLRQIESDPLQAAQMQKSRDLFKYSIFPNLYQISQQQPELKIGSLNLAEMFKRFDQVRVFQATDEKMVFQVDFIRTSDFYWPEFHIAIFNSRADHKDPIARRGILTHVFLGASGYADYNYELTMALEHAEKAIQTMGYSILSSRRIDWSRLIPDNLIQKTFTQNNTTNLDYHLKGQELFYPLLDKADKRIFVADSGGGGTTGAGGGGDITVAGFKLELINFEPIQSGLITKEAPCYQSWSDHNNYLRDMQLLKIESNLHSKGPNLVDSSVKGLYISIPPTEEMARDEFIGLINRVITYACHSKYTK